MYDTLEAELRRRKIRRKDLAEQLDLTIGTISLKLNGKAPITLGEANTIKKILGVQMPLEELFKSSDMRC